MPTTCRSKINPDRHTQEKGIYLQDWACYAIDQPFRHSSDLEHEAIHKNRINSTFDYSRHDQIHEFALPRMNMHVCCWWQLESVDVF